MAIGKGEVVNELACLGKCLVGLVAAIFPVLANFFKWAGGQQRLNGRPHPILVANIPTNLALPHDTMGMEDACNPTSSKDVVFPAKVAHSNVLRAVMKSPTVHE